MPAETDAIDPLVPVDGQLTLGAEQRLDRFSSTTNGLARQNRQMAKSLRQSEQLRRMESRYRQLFENLSQGVIGFGPDGEVMEVNGAASRMLKLAELGPKPDLLGQWLNEDGSALGRAEHPVGRTFATGRPKQAVLGHGPTGVWVQMETLAEFRPGEAAPFRVNAIFSNVTERRQIEETHRFLAQSGTQGQAFFQSLAGFIARQLGMDYVSIDRLEPDPLLARTVAVHYRGRVEPNVLYPLLDTPSGQTLGQSFWCAPWGVRHRFPNHAALQQMKAESFAGTTLWGSTGQPIGLISVICGRPLADPHRAEALLQMVSLRAAGELERLDAEEALSRLNGELEARIRARMGELQQTLQSLRDSEQKYRNLFEHLPDGFSCADLDGHILEANQAFQDMVGYTMAELRGMPFLELTPERWHQPNGEMIRNELLVLGFTRMFEKEMRRRDGTVFPVQLTAFLERGAGGEPRGSWAVIKDVTETKRAEALQLTLAGLKAKSQIAAYIAHEINNPLAGIKQSFQIIAQDIPSQHPDRPFVDIITRELDRIASIVRMAYSIHRPGQPQVRLAAIADTLADLGRLLSSKLRGKHLILDLPDLDPGLKGRLHEDILRQILFNVLQNAIEATPERGLIRCRSWREDRELVVEVENEGPEITAEVAQHLFEPGFTTKFAPETGGLGMGLATCRAILGSVGGTIGFRNLAPGPGVCFTVRLPFQV